MRTLATRLAERRPVPINQRDLRDLGFDNRLLSDLLTKPRIGQRERGRIHVLRNQNQEAEKVEL
jgi:hypothetical protein